MEEARLDSEKGVRSTLARRRVKRVHQFRERDENVIRANACFFCLLVWLLFSLAWFHACVPLSLFFAALLPRAICFWLLMVGGCLLLLAAGLFRGPGCSNGGLLIDGAGASMVWLGGWFGSALLALLPGVTCRCWQLVGFTLLEWFFVLDFGLHVKLSHSGSNLVRIIK